MKFFICMALVATNLYGVSSQDIMLFGQRSSSQSRAHADVPILINEIEKKQTDCLSKMGKLEKENTNLCKRDLIDFYNEVSKLKDAIIAEREENRDGPMAATGVFIGSSITAFIYAYLCSNVCGK